MKAPEERPGKANVVSLKDTMHRLSGTVVAQRRKLDSIGGRLKALIEDSKQADAMASHIKPLQKQSPILIVYYRQKADGSVVVIEQGIKHELDG